ncbi:MAG: transglycosylase SLT domain-containing protein [Betaproteobacteria bacterium]|nr:transglycosylase SLT domain-containing protein [Betaproteobacteria bacterium]
MAALSAVEGPVPSIVEEPAHAEETLALSSQPATQPADPALEPAAVPAAPDAAASTDIEPALPADAGLSKNDLWQRIRNGFAMHELDSRLVARHEQWYANRPDYVARMTERAQRYLYFIVEEVEKRGMPTEIALLPMIESAFNPGAYSVSRASGIWQFIPSTGRNFGMKQNWWYDGRRDIISATNGALDYLQKLHDQFGDWELALAAYNWGENAVERAQAHNRKKKKPVNYASLKLPRETRGYVPKLLAVKHIISDPARFGLTLQPIPDQPYFAAVSTSRHIDVKLAAQLADISLDEFSALNPAHNRPVILQEYNDVLLLPVDKIETFRANLESYSEPLVSWQAYKSKKGERLDKLAPHFGLSVEKLRSVNGLSPRTKLSNGQALLVPLNGEDASNEFKAFNTHLAPSDLPRGRIITHTVRKGETLANIARRYHVSLAKLQDWNNGVEQLQTGQVITIVQHGKPRRLTKTGSRKTQRRMRIAYNTR